ncbi:YcjF family protein [Roseicyclus sp.]|uniref:YcjF family protein n=1 Tax=Roseicyclus sp. TaxID=1914329 RepID=UPI003F6ACC6F
MTRRKGPVMIEIADPAPIMPQEAALPPDAVPIAEGRAMLLAARLAGRRPSRLTRLFWSAATGLIALMAGIAAWDFVTGLLAARPALGWLVTGLAGLLMVSFGGLALREALAFRRFGRLDQLRGAADAALAAGDLAAARHLVGQLDALYRGRAELAGARAELAQRRDEIFDAAALLALAETRLLAPLDAAARLEVEATARHVATVTALVPIALADMLAALTGNIRMIRRIAEIYGGRSGPLGTWRLTRAVLTHLVATGAVAIGDDLIGSVAGGSVLSKISRRFGEGVVNGALTARVGVAAMEVCRPLPFGPGQRPGVSALLRRALTGLFGAGTG